MTLTVRNNVIVWGPRNSGKTKYAETLAIFYGMRKVKDDISRIDQLDRGIDNHLILCETVQPEMRLLGRVVYIEDALIEAGIKPEKAPEEAEG